MDLKGSDKFGVWKNGKYVFPESVLSEGEKFHSHLGSGKKLAKTDRMRGRFFVRLEDNKERGEVVKCVLCGEKFSKKAVGKLANVPVEERNSQKMPRFKLSVFYTHLVCNHGAVVKKMGCRDLPRDYDCRRVLKSFFEEEEWSDMRVSEEELKEMKARLCEEKKKKEIKEEGKSKERRGKKRDEAPAAAPPLKGPIIPAVSSAAPSSSSASASSSSSPTTLLSFFCRGCLFLHHVNKAC